MRIPEDLKVSIIGIGPVGLVTGAVFAKQGHDVVVADVDKERVTALNSGEPPFYEPGLDELVKDLVSRGLLRGMLKPPDDSENVPDYYNAIADTDVTFICVGTPPNPDGSMNLDYIKKASTDLGTALRDKSDYHVVVSKSTIIPGTTEAVILKRIEDYSLKRRGVDFGACSNPEFLLEGNALAGALTPDRIVIGELDKRSGDVLMALYRDLNDTIPRLRVDIRTAEMIKYASNSLLATKIAFANEMATICETFGIDVYEVMAGVGLDYRINPEFLRAGVGFGGSCFPKDVKAIATAASSKGLKVPLLDSVLWINDFQPRHAVELAERAAGDLKDKEVCILGLAFKPDTDDVRETRALPILRALIEKGCRVTGYDPKPEAMTNFKKHFLHDDFSTMNFARSIEEAIENKDIVIIQNEWAEFKKIEPRTFKRLMKEHPIVIDGRRIYEPELFLEAGITYRGIGWKGNVKGGKDER
jgi:UDPglucose 6-dehydrogenase